MAAISLHTPHSSSTTPSKAPEPQNSLIPFLLIHELASENLDRFFDFTPEDLLEITHCSLVQDLERRGYDSSGKGTLHKEEIKKFLNSLMEYYGKYRQSTSLQPFGYGPGLPFPLLCFGKREYLSNGIPRSLPSLAGITFSYVAKKINPLECKQNALSSNRAFLL